MTDVETASPKEMTRRLPVLTHLLVTIFGGTFFLYLALYAIFYLHTTVKGPCASCNFIEVWDARRLSPAFATATTTYIVFSGLILAVLSTTNRKRCMSVFRIALVSGGVLCALFGTAMTFTDFQKSDKAFAIAEAVFWLSVSAAATWSYLRLKPIRIEISRMVAICATIGAIVLWFGLSSLISGGTKDPDTDLRANSWWEKQEVGATFESFGGASGGRNGDEPAYPRVQVSDLPLATSAIVPPIGAGAAYRRLAFDCGISVSIPAHWKILSQDDDLNIQARVQAQGVPPSSVGRKTLLLVNSSPEPSAAHVRLIRIPETELSKATLLSVAADDEALKAMAAAFQQSWNASSSTGGLSVVNMRPLRVEKLAGQAAIHLSYDRTGLNGDGNWRVDQFKIPTEGHLVTYTVSYRLSQEQMYKPMLDATLASLTVAEDCK